MTINKAFSMLGLAGLLTFNYYANAQTINTNLKKQSLDSLAKKEAEYTQKYNTSAHNVIRIEKKWEEDEKQKNEKWAYKILDNFIDSIKVKKINFPKDDKEIVNVLEIINYEIKKKSGFSYGLQALFSKGLEKRKIDCSDFSLLYNACGEEMNWPIKLVYAPGHVFIRWLKEDGTYINWETTSGEQLSDEYYKKWFKINDLRLEKGIYLKNLNKLDLEAMAYYNVAVNKLDQGDYRESIRACNNSLIKQYKNMDCQFLRGISFIGDLQFKKSIKNFNRIIKLDPYLSEAYLGKGLSLACQLKFKKSLKNYDEGLKIDSTLTSLYLAKGLTLDIIGKNEQAVYNYNKAIGLEDKLIQNYINRTIPVLASKGISSKIINSFDKEINKDSTNVLFYLTKGKYNILKGNIDMAIQDFDKAINLDSTIIEPYFLKGKLLKNDFKYQEAEKCYTKALQIKKEDPDLLYLRAETRLGQRKYCDAIDDYDLILKNSPADNEAIIEKKVAEEWMESEFKKK